MRTHARARTLPRAGDSRAVLRRGGAVVPLTDDHKPERTDEAERVRKAGGHVFFWQGARVMGVLAMSRAIGDTGLRPYVIPEPEVGSERGGRGRERRTMGDW
jgi:protein phosphatase 2C